MAHMWNNIRLSRLRLHQVVLGHCDRIQTQSPNSVDANRTSSPTDSSRSSKTPELPSQRGHSEAIVVDLAREICASVPQLADYMSQLPSFAERKRREKERNCKVSDIHTFVTVAYREYSSFYAQSRRVQEDKPAPLTSGRDASTNHGHCRSEASESVPHLLPAADIVDDIVSTRSYEALDPRPAPLDRADGRCRRPGNAQRNAAEEEERLNRMPCASTLL